VGHLAVGMLLTNAIFTRLAIPVGRTVFPLVLPVVVLYAFN
jgi:hypothetical protein